MDEKTGEVGEVKLNDGYANDGYAKYVEEILSEFLPKFITKPTKLCKDWIECFDGVQYILTTLRQR
jgi:hypothetical protein